MPSRRVGNSCRRSSAGRADVFGRCRKSKWSPAPSQAVAVLGVGSSSSLCADDSLVSFLSPFGKLLAFPKEDFLRLCFPFFFETWFSKFPPFVIIFNRTQPPFTRSFGFVARLCCFFDSLSMGCNSIWPLVPSDCTRVIRKKKKNDHRSRDRAICFELSPEFLGWMAETTC